MKRFLQKCVCALCAAVTALSLLTPAGAYSYALGDEISLRDTSIHQRTQLSENVFWSSVYSDFRTEHFITYYPGTQVHPVVTYGNVLNETVTLTSEARTLEAQGYRVVGGINGDFYNVNNGLPVGLILTDHQVRSSDAGLYALGFRADGSAIMGRPRVEVSANFGYQMDDGYGNMIDIVRTLAGINKVRVSTGGIFLFTYDFNRTHTTGNSESGIDAVCTILDGSLSIGSRVRLRVDRIIRAEGRTAIEPGQIVLSVNNRADAYSRKAMENLSVGNVVTVSLTAANPVWNDVEYGIGATYLLAENGRVSNNLPTGANPRTAVGLRSDGSLIFYTIDGRHKGYSIGATLAQTAERLIELGCHTVLGLDGGGSTTLSVTMPGASSAATVNTPSEGVERAVSNHIFLVTSGQPTGILSHFYVSADHDAVLSGSRVNLTVSAVDTNYYPISGYTDYRLETDGGILSGSTLLTPVQGGTITVTASNRGQSGTTRITAVRTPDSITVRNAAGTAISSLNLTPGASVQLSASAVWQNRELYADPEVFTWTGSSEAGSVSPDGLFTALRPGTGSVVVSAGDRRVSIPFTVAKVGLALMDDFETAPAGQGVYADLTRAVGGEEARYGRASGALRYDLSDSTLAAWRYANPLPLPGAPYDTLTLWVMGDGSGHDFSLLINDPSGAQTQIFAAKLDFTGWRQIIVPLGGAEFSLVGFAVSLSEDELAELLSVDPGDEYFSEDPDGPDVTPSLPDMDSAASGNGVSDPDHFFSALYSEEVNGAGSNPIRGDDDFFGELFNRDPDDASGDWWADLFDAESDTLPDDRPVIYLDQIVAAYDGLTDADPPVITLTRSGQSLRAEIRDEMDDVLPAKSVTLCYNGEPVSGDFYNAYTGILTWTIPDTKGEPSRVSVTAQDASGNIASAAADIPPDGNHNQFTDIDNCWAADYINFLANRGIATPYRNGEYHPYDIITRVEFAVMLSRAAGFDPDDYADIELPYADLDEIPEAAVPALKALYAENVMRGADGPDGRLYLMPDSGLTRAQASAMIGRSQKRGYASTELSFPDADTIPEYARSHIQVMAAREILAGYDDGTFRPQAQISRGQMAKILYFLS